VHFQLEVHPYTSQPVVVAVLVRQDSATRSSRVPKANRFQVQDSHGRQGGRHIAATGLCHGCSTIGAYVDMRGSYGYLASGVGNRVPLHYEHQPLFRLQEWGHRPAITIESTHALPTNRKLWVASSTEWMDSSLRESVRLLKPSRKHSGHDIPGPQGFLRRRGGKRILCDAEPSEWWGCPLTPIRVTVRSFLRATPTHASGLTQTRPAR
jgi:hypothetical protein